MCGKLKCCSDSVFNKTNRPQIWHPFRRYSDRNCMQSAIQIFFSYAVMNRNWHVLCMLCFHLCLYRLLMSTGCKSSHSGFLDVSRSNGYRYISNTATHCLWLLSGLWRLFCYWKPLHANNVKDIRLDWPTFMFDDFLHQLVSGSLPS